MRVKKADAYNVISKSHGHMVVAGKVIWVIDAADVIPGWILNLFPKHGVPWTKGDGVGIEIEVAQGTDIPLHCISRSIRQSTLLIIVKPQHEDWALEIFGANKRMNKKEPNNVKCLMFDVWCFHNIFLSC